MSILFVDAIGSTPFAEQADPETVRARQSDFFAIVRAVMGQYGGVVEKYIGDAVLVLFGAPVASPTDAVRCVRAGLDVQRSLSDDGVGWAFRVGIATGEALVDIAAAHDGGQAIVAGDVVNTAARLQAHAPAGGVLVCGATYAATRTEVRYLAQEPLTLRGRSTPTQVWLAQAPVPHHSIDEPDEIASVGREHELALLSTTLDHIVRDGSPRLVTIVGRAGIGKSRLVREFYRTAHDRPGIGLRWLGGHCPPFGENRAHAALAEVIRQHLGIVDDAPTDVVDDRITAAVADLAPAGEAGRLSRALRLLLGLPDPTGSPIGVDEAESAWLRLFAALAARGPTVLVIEDLHWADERSRAFIDLLAGTVRDVPLLLVVTTRPEPADRSTTVAPASTGTLAISLAPLRDESIAQLYTDMFGPTVLPSQLLRPLVELADGMPLYAHEYARMLVDKGTVSRDDDGAWTVRPDHDLPMPANVYAVIANRIDLLESDERAVLHAAAVVGPRFWAGAVGAGIGAAGDLVEHALRTLVRRDLVREQPRSCLPDETEFRFRHVLVREICYERLTRSERIAQHVRVADWLADVSDRRDALLDRCDDAASNHSRVADHRYAAFDTARSLGVDTAPYRFAALATVRRAAMRAVLAGRPDEANELVGRAADLIAAGAGDADRHAVELIAAEVTLLRDPRGFLSGPAPDRLHELATLLFQAGDPGAAGRAWTVLGHVAWLRADRVAALRCLDRAVELFDTAPESAEKAHAYAELGRLHMLNFEHSPALGAAQIGAEIAERHGLTDLRSSAMITVGICRFQAGHPDALAELTEVWRFCRSHQLPSLGRAEHAIAEARRELGEPDELDQGHPANPYEWLAAARTDPAGATAARAHELATARRSGLWRGVWSALARAALCHAVLGEKEPARRALDELGESWRRMRSIAGRDWVAAAAHAAVLAGPEAAAALRDIVVDAPAHTGWSRAALASLDAAIIAATDPTAAAARHVDAAHRYARLGSVADEAFAMAAAADPTCPTSPAWCWSGGDGG